jgi:AsmA protein
MTFSGSGQLQNASIKPPNFRQPLAVHNASIKFSNDAAILQNVSATLGQTNANGAITVRDFAAPNLQFTLNADKVNVVELQQITGNAPAQAAPGKRAAAGFFNVLPRAQAAPAGAPASSLLASTTGSGTLNIGTVIYDQLVLNNLRSTVTLDRGVIRMAPLTANLYDGQESGSIIVDTRTTPMAVTVASSLSNVKANNLISSVSSLRTLFTGCWRPTRIRASPSATIAISPAH